MLAPKTGLRKRSLVHCTRALVLSILVASMALCTSCHRHPPRTSEALRRQAIDLLAEGEQLERGGEYSLAINRYLQALETSPRPVVFYHLGHCYLETGDAERAVGYLREATARAKDFRLAQLELEKAQALLQQQKTRAVAALPHQTGSQPAGTAKSKAPETEAVAEQPTPPPAPIPAKETIPPQPSATIAPPPAATPRLAPAAVSSPSPAPPSEEKPQMVNAPTEIPPPTPIEAVPARGAITPTLTPAPTPSGSPTPTPVPAEAPKPKRVLPSREEVSKILFPSLYGDEKESKEEVSSDLQFIKDREVFLGSFEYHRAKAESYAANKNYDEAILEYQDALGFNPRSLESRLALAELYVKTDRLQRAEQAYLAALELFPNEPKIYFKLANLYLQTKDYARAEMNYQKTIGLEPRNKAAHNNLGILYMNSSRYTEAAESFQEALKLDPNYADACLNAGILYERYLKEPKKALQYYRKYVQLDGKRKDEVTGWIKDVESFPAP
jgi:tetratricopeptide (TPR) repeat protein